MDSDLRTCEPGNEDLNVSGQPVPEPEAELEAETTVLHPYTDGGLVDDGWQRIVLN